MKLVSIEDYNEENKIYLAWGTCKYTAYTRKILTFKKYIDRNCKNNLFFLTLYNLYSGQLLDFWNL
jgi:hypothetical protein